jgi:hypothetical protein
MHRVYSHIYYDFCGRGHVRSSGGGDGGTSDLADRLAILVAVRRFPSVGAAVSRSLQSENYAPMKEFAWRSACVPSVDSLGMCVVSSCCAFLRFFMARWAPISVTPCKRMVHLHAPLLRGLRFIMCTFSFLLCWWIPLHSL